MFNQTPSELPPPLYIRNSMSVVKFRKALLPTYIFFSWTILTTRVIPVMMKYRNLFLKNYPNLSQNVFSNMDE